MRILLAIVILAALGWSGYWYFGAQQRQRVLEDWLAERRADGWVAEAADIGVTGFPNRLDTIVKGLEIADPASGWAWEAQEFQILSLSYKPHHLIAAWPGEQIVGTPAESVRINSERMRGSLIFEPDTSLTLDHATIEMDKVAMAGDSGWTASIDRALLSVRQAEGADFHYDVALDAEGLAPPEKLTALVGAGVLPQAVSEVKLDSTVAFDRAWNRQSVEEDNPRIEGIEIREFAADWGEFDLRGQGNLVADSEGLAEGEVKLRARNWQRMLELAESSGALKPAVAGGIRAGLDLLAMFSGDKETLTVPLEFEAGTVRIGPVPIGDAPRLRPAE